MIESELDLPVRSKLFPVAPLIQGDRESLTSYVIRLARQNGTDTMGMVRWLRQFYPAQQHAAAWLRALSGTGLVARQGALLIAEKTGQEDLYGLTLHPLELLVRECWDDRSKWCPECLVMANPSVVSFIPLRWSVRGYNVCLQHRQRLTYKCSCGSPNYARLTIANCDKCGGFLSEQGGDDPVTEQDEGYRQSIVIEAFLQHINSLGFSAHKNSFIALSELIRTRAARRESRNGLGRGGERLIRPTLLDASRISLQKNTPMCELFSIDDTSRDIGWPRTDLVKKPTEIDWTPVLQMAEESANRGRPLTIDLLQQRFAIDPALLRLRLRRAKIPWQRVRLIMTVEERGALEAARQEEVLVEARAWLAGGGTRYVKEFRRAMLLKLGSWFGRRLWTTTYSNIFRRLLPEYPVPPHSGRSEIDWSPIYQAAMMIGTDGQLPDAPELARRFGVQQSTLRMHFARNGMRDVTQREPRLNTSDRRSLETERTQKLCELSRVWLDDGNIRSFAAMAASMQSTEYKWVGRKQYRSRYMKIFKTHLGTV